MENFVEILKALADQSRYKIVALLLRHNLCVGALAKRLEISEASVSQHLQVLRKAGVVKGEKIGYFTHYQVNRELLRAVSNEFVEMASISQEKVCRDHGQNQDSQCCDCKRQ